MLQALGELATIGRLLVRAAAVVAAKTPRWLRWGAFAVVVVTCAAIASPLLVADTDASIPAPVRRPTPVFVIGAIRSSDAVLFENLAWVVKEEVRARVESIPADGRPQLRIEGTVVSVDVPTHGPARLRCTVQFMVMREDSRAIRSTLAASAPAQGPVTALAEDACRHATRVAMRSVPRLVESR